ncbi:hypothetical protein ACIQ1D_01840 [Lysinibacillus xylanilyticus]|uniref:hypothetical protein n=1 Tax=Lysinibacillus xylanilyticus TaxID=582475 RepID=UPI003816FBC4
MTNETEKTIIEMLQELKAEMTEMKQDMNQRLDKLDKRFEYNAFLDSLCRLFEGRIFYVQKSKSSVICWTVG